MMLLQSTFSEVLDSDVLTARKVFRDGYGFDPLSAPHFWESWCATALGGHTTAHKAAHDVIAIGRRAYRFEVKFSRSFTCSFANGARRVFKWMLTKPQMDTEDKVDAVICLGCDLESDMLWVWVIPPRFIRCRSLTVTHPLDRTERFQSRGFDRFSVPAFDLLPGVLRNSNLTYDRHHHAKNAAASRRARSLQLDMLPPASCPDIAP